MAEPPYRPDPQEPSMEDILASIRSILNEDEGRDAPPPLDLTEEMLVPAPRTPAGTATPQPPARPPLPLRRLANIGPAPASPAGAPPAPGGSPSTPAPAALPPPVAIVPPPAEPRPPAPRPEPEAGPQAAGAKPQPQAAEAKPQAVEAKPQAAGPVPLVPEPAAGRASAPHAAELEEGLLGPVAAAAAAAALGQLARAVTEDRQAPVTRQGGASIEDVVREELRPLLKAWLEQHLPPMVERLVKAEIGRVMSGGRGG
ncbi:DUF2497 domain-containing protein [Teichococcus aestuarii]|uniref:DUF2497 domain-containing protein n=1 Tax=Teichococcus aestuarii TaxID=568898 RepID=UPI00361D0415